jgi:hypothetical protein
MNKQSEFFGQDSHLSASSSRNAGGEKRFEENMHKAI